MEIKKLFMIIEGNQSVSLKKVKNVAKFNLLKPPNDLRELKKMVGRCKYCKKPTDNLRYCLLCPEVSCLDCKEWNAHL
jgi:hypothetical protein